MGLTNALMEPIFSIFNIRFGGDTDLIISEVGDAWKDLNNADNLCHPTVDGNPILFCTLDTIMVMTRALTHNSDGNEAEEEKRAASALTEEDIKRASRWYKGSKQKETHTRIRELLTAEGRPKDNSIETLQMKVVISHLQQLMTFATQSLGVLTAVGIAGMVGTAGTTVFLAKWLKAKPAAGNVGNQSIPRLQSMWRSWLVRNNGVAA
ncbi:hypothetical protein EX30DRAFT_337222 [Ascodesmis nigricans]|uniref:Uncharacterized protein n=1 Tax=Ascodesmis nigricans TaxID=341454 RepID=A0A4S2N662_9PEZI|nr:hypothetical protein EX30DRAFT_337222 [Ascodesmis nigricans]